MRAVVLKRYEPHGVLAVEDIADPVLKRGQVLVRMAAAPIHPSDLVFLQNRYGVQKPLPVVPGFEGSGVVVESAANGYGRFLVGRRVAARAPADGNGTWAEYMAVEASGCVPLRGSVSLEQGASLLINPLTAWALLEIARREGHSALIQTAAASAVGRMIARLARRRGIVCVNIVRRPDQAELLRREGSDAVVDASQPGWEKDLRRQGERGIFLMLDAVGGEITAAAAQAMPPRGEIVVYGALAGRNVQLAPSDLIFRGLSMRGFWLSRWWSAQPVWRRLRIAWTVQGCLASELRTEVQASYSLEEIHEAMSRYRSRRTQGKVLLAPGRSKRGG